MSNEVFDSAVSEFFGGRSLMVAPEDLDSIRLAMNRYMKRNAISDCRFLKCKLASGIKLRLLEIKKSVSKKR